MENNEGKGITKMKLLVVSVTVILIIASAGVYTYLKSRPLNSSYRPIEVYWDITQTPTDWIIKIIHIGHDDKASPRGIDTSYTIINDTGVAIEVVEGGFIYDINESQSPHGLRWVDLNNGRLINVGDYFQVSKSGGSAGKFDPSHDTLIVEEYPYINFNPRKIHLPPTDFLDVNVNKTSTGWNMTVTWVNNDVPEMVRNWTYFRLENESGEFFANVQKNDIVGEWVTEMSLTGTYYKIEPYSGNEWGTHRNMGFYNITWYDYDNDHRISVNDSIIIDNNRGLIKSGFTFKFVYPEWYCELYIMEEIILK